MSKGWLEASDIFGFTTGSDHEDVQVPDQTTDKVSKAVVEEQTDTLQGDFRSPFPSEYRVVEVKKYRLRK